MTGGWTDAGNDNTPSAWKAEGKNADILKIYIHDVLTAVLPVKDTSGKRSSWDMATLKWEQILE